MKTFETFRESRSREPKFLLRTIYENRSRISERSLFFYIFPGLCERETLGNSVDCQGSLEFGGYEE